MLMNNSSINSKSSKVQTEHPTVQSLDPVMKLLRDGPPRTPEEHRLFAEHMVRLANFLYPLVPEGIRRKGPFDADALPDKTAWQGLIFFLFGVLPYLPNGVDLLQQIKGNNMVPGLRQRVMYAANALPADACITVPVIEIEIIRQGWGEFLNIEGPRTRISQYLLRYEKDNFLRCTERGRGRRPSKYKRTKQTYMDYIWRVTANEEAIAV